MGALRIDSNRDGAFALIDNTFRSDYYRAELQCGSLAAAVEFYEMNLRPMGDFFGDLAAKWRGWESELHWRSLEGEVRFAATHDKLGTITLAVQLRSDVYAPTGGYTWTATGLLFLDAGGLDELAREAAQLAA